MKSMNFVTSIPGEAISYPAIQDSRIRSSILHDLESRELEELARSAGYTEDEICEMLGKPLKELPLSFNDDPDFFINQFEDVPF